MRNVNLEIGRPLFHILMDRLMSVGDVEVKSRKEEYFVGDFYETRRGVILINFDFVNFSLYAIIL